MTMVRRLLIVLVALALLVTAFGLVHLQREDPPLPRGTSAGPLADAELVAYLGRCSPAELDAFCADHDSQSLMDAYFHTSDRIVMARPDSVPVVLARYLPGLERLAMVMTERGFTQGPLHQVQFLRRSSLPAIQSALANLRRVNEVYNDRDLEPSQKYRETLALADSLATVPVFLAYVESRLVELAADLGEHGRKRAHLHRSIELSRQTGRYPMLSQLLGTLCDDRLAAGQIDTARILADEALDVALRAGAAAQAGRIHFILGAYHAARGELSLASDYFDAAVEVAQRLDGRYYELRWLTMQLQFYADLGCWDLVGRNLPRMQMLARNAPKIAAEPRFEQIWLPSLQLMAGYMSQTGNQAAADSLYGEAVELARGAPRAYVYPQALAEWAGWQLDHGSVERGLDLARAGLEAAQERQVTSVLRRLHGLLAHAHVLRGDAAAAADAIRSMKRLAPADTSEALAGTLHELELAALNHDRNAMATLADQAVAQLVAGLRAWGHRAEMYLEFQRQGRIRDRLIQDLIDDGDDGLALALAWRDLRQFTAEVEAGRSTADLAGLLKHGRRRLQALRRWCHEHDARAVIYVELSDELVCWRIGEAGTGLDMIPAPGVRALRAALPRVLARLSATDETIGDDLEADLEGWATILQPLAGTDGGGRGLLLGVPDSLRQLPFEALDLRSGPGYEPLVSRVRVAYLSRRGVREATAAPSPGPSCVAGIPMLSPSLQRQQPSLRFLPAAADEARLAATLLPSPRLLLDSQAHKSALLAAFESAGTIYIAGHAAQDPDMPYRTFLPCAVPAGEHDLMAGRIGLRDILSLDLEGCRLVVLSNCRSGVGHTTRYTVGPSLADAFTDAGAAAVLSTRWPLADTEAAGFMTGLLRRRQDPTVDATWRALAESQLQSADGGTTWMNFHLELAVLPAGP